MGTVDLNADLGEGFGVWKLGDDDPLIGSGVIDSIGVVELIAFLQDAFGVTIPEDEITEHNLGSLAAIGRFVHNKGNGGRRESEAVRSRPG